MAPWVAGGLDNFGREVDGEFTWGARRGALLHYSSWGTSNPFPSEISGQRQPTRACPILASGSTSCTRRRPRDTERPHQGLGNVTIEENEQVTGEVECHERLGSLLKSYRRAA